MSSDLEINDFVAMQLVKLSQILLSPLRARTHRGPHLNQLMVMKKILFTLLAALTLTGCNAQNNKTQMTNHKCLVVFFSHAGENYSVGNIQVGNTKIVADYISELTGADQFEIVTHKYDGMAYTPLTELAQEEARNDERPAFEGVLTSNSGSVQTSNSEALSNYDIIFIGGPIWRKRKPAMTSVRRLKEF